jgi:hypothetical protein
MIEGKTAALIAAAGEMGALSAGADGGSWQEYRALPLSRSGVSGADDALDIRGDPALPAKKLPWISGTAKITPVLADWNTAPTFGRSMPNQTCSMRLRLSVRFISWIRSVHANTLMSWPRLLGKNDLPSGSSFTVGPGRASAV